MTRASSCDWATLTRRLWFNPATGKYHPVKGARWRLRMRRTRPRSMVLAVITTTP
jgi:hypothetical protein